MIRTRAPLTEAQRQLAADNIGLAITFGPHFAGKRLRHDEAVSVAMETLVLAASGYDKGLRAKFSGYATCAIRNNVWRKCQHERRQPFAVAEFRDHQVPVCRREHGIAEADAEQAERAKAMAATVMAIAEEVLPPRSFEMLRLLGSGEPISVVARRYKVYPNSVRYAVKRARREILAELTRRGQWLELQRVLGIAEEA